MRGKSRKVLALQAWEESALGTYLLNLRLEDKALLRLLADAGGAMHQKSIMEKHPFCAEKRVHRSDR